MKTLREHIEAAVKVAPKGKNIKATIERPVKLKKAYEGLPLIKRTTMTVRVGVDNGSRKAVIEARERGDRPAEVQPLKGREWVNFPTLMRSLKDAEQFYVRFEPSINCNEKPKPEFIIRAHGKETVVSKADYEHMMLSSEKRPSRPFDACFDCKIENIVAIHNYNIAAEVAAEVAAIAEKTKPEPAN